MPDEHEGNLERKMQFRASLILIVFVAAAVLVAITYVQNSRVPGGVEITVRACASVSGLLAVPVLLFLAFRNWIRTSRVKSPEWRNGLALSSMILVSLVWMSRFVTSTVYAAPRIGSDVLHVDPLSWLATLLYSTMLAALLAIALKGTARLFMFSAALLMWSSLQSGIFF
jgi:hypothetical protein